MANYQYSEAEPYPVNVAVRCRKMKLSRDLTRSPSARAASRQIRTARRIKVTVRQSRVTL